MRTILAFIGEDPHREGLVDTPKRVVAALDDFFLGYAQKPDGYISDTLVKASAKASDYATIVLLRNVPFFTHDENDMRLILGTAHIGYSPGKFGFVEISEFAELVEYYSRRLQSLENLSQDILTAIDEIIQPKGCAVVLDARRIDGLNKQRVERKFAGCFERDAREKERFLELLS